MNPSTAAGILLVCATVFWSNPTAAQDSFALFNPFEPSGTEQQTAPATQLKVTKSFKRRPFRAARQLFCVRSCDGRYFSVASSADEATCRNMCPNADARIYKGATIEAAVSSDGKSYAKTRHAFRFRTEFVPECSCLATSSTGISHVSIEDDPTLRTGDIVASANGLMTANRKRRSEVVFRPLSNARIKAERLPAIAVQ
jgi:hypothetical protein